MSAIHRACVLSLILTVMTGCNGGNSVPVYPAKGVVLLEGAPVDFAVVAFVPEKGSTAVAMTDDEGKFLMTLPAGRKGVPAGNYKVSIRKSAAKSEGATEPTTFEEMERQHQQGITPAAPTFKPGIPPRYSDPQTSELRVEVTPAGTNEFTFDLKG